jgi:hypothetical protein
MLATAAIWRSDLSVHFGGGLQMRSQWRAISCVMMLAAAVLALMQASHAADNNKSKPGTKPAVPARSASPAPVAPPASRARTVAPLAARTLQMSPQQQRKPDATAVARAQQAEINKRREAEATALRARQAAINRQNDANLAAVRSKQAEINKRQADEAAKRAAAARNGASEVPKKIISKNSALGQASTAAQGPGVAAKVFDGGR